MDGIPVADSFYHLRFDCHTVSSNKLIVRYCQADVVTPAHRRYGMLQYEMPINCLTTRRSATENARMSKEFVTPSAWEDRSHARPPCFAPVA